eukprot:7382006-Prymnesium_polylepis.1
MPLSGATNMATRRSILDSCRNSPCSHDVWELNVVSLGATNMTTRCSFYGWLQQPSDSTCCSAIRAEAAAKAAKATPEARAAAKAARASAKERAAAKAARACSSSVLGG